MTPNISNPATQLRIHTQNSGNTRTQLLVFLFQTQRVGFLRNFQIVIATFFRLRISSASRNSFLMFWGFSGIGFSQWEIQYNKRSGEAHRSQLKLNCQRPSRLTTSLFHFFVNGDTIGSSQRTPTCKPNNFYSKIGFEIDRRGRGK